MGLQEALKWAGVNNNAKFLMNTKAEKWCRFWRCTSGDTSYGLKSKANLQTLALCCFW